MLHPGGDFSRIAQSDRADCRSTSAQKSAEGSSFFSGDNNARQKRNQLYEKRLMKVIPKSTPTVLVFLAGRIFLAADVRISKSGTKRTNFNLGDT
jgi:hypothetical protein